MRDADPHRPKVERSGDLTILTITARATGGGLARELVALGADAGARHVLLDLAHVGFVSGTGLGTLVGLHNRVAAAGGRLTLFNLSADVLRVFPLTRLDTLLDVCRPCASPAGT
jgi:anti-anti-sigma factor